MNDGQQTAAGGVSSAEPPSTGNGGPQTGDRNDNWLDRLRAVVGLKNGGSFRADLEQALASEETAEAFSPDERAMLRSILRLRDVRVEDVMVPRADIEAVEIHTPLATLLQDFRESGHSRMPVYCDTLDDPRGMVHIKDVMGYVVRSASKGDEERTNSGAGALDLTAVDLTRPLSELDLVRNVLFVPPSMPAASLLAKMQNSRMQMALVIDEYGGTDGLVSLEDIVEIVVGEIEDEHDDAEGPMIVAEGDGSFLADGRADLDEVGKMIGRDLSRTEDQEDVDTIGGLIFSLLGRIPVRGELVAGPDGYEFEILDADPRRIKRLRIRRRKPPRRPRAPADPNRTAGDPPGTPSAA